ncbi:co-regulatory protein PtrA N-terminal domain-containing protein [Pseudomonas sp. KCJK9016]|uniref:co-regulatory protein PtrA N-terminal domain-containing protein n=1 Tax=Pseudomonas sp. KCJK9016 TaxID=3344556 RepID=UPI003905A422
MKPVQIGAFLLALAVSSLAMAEGGGDRTFDRMMTHNDRSMELFVAKEKARDPVVVNDKKDDSPQDL